MDWLINVLQSWIKDVTDEFDTLLYATYCILNNYLYQFLLVVDAGIMCVFGFKAIYACPKPYGIFTVSSFITPVNYNQAIDHTSFVIFIMYHVCTCSISCVWHSSTMHSYSSVVEIGL